MNREEIERRFALSGWELDGSFWEYLVIGYSGEEISLLAHKDCSETNSDVADVNLVRPKSTCHSLACGTSSWGSG